MKEAESGDTVRVHYTGKLTDDSVFDTSKDRAPLEFTIGDGKLIPGFETGVIGMKTGETKTITIPPEQAYGEKRQELVAEMEKKNLPDTITPSVGLQLQMKQPEGNIIIVTITEIHDDTITIDANPPLAGETLTFEIELVEFA